MVKRVPSIQQIIDELRARPSNEEYFQLLFEHYAPSLFRLFARRGLSPEDRLDLIQETFVGIYKGIGSFRREAQFETWLFEIAVNAHRKMIRLGAAQKRAGQEVPLGRAETEEDPEMQEALSSHALGPDEEALCREQSQKLREAIMRLPPQMRRCLCLRIDQDLKIREIALVMRLSTGTVKAHISEARLRLQKEFGPEATSSPSNFDDVEP